MITRQNCRLRRHSEGPDTEACSCAISYRKMASYSGLSEPVAPDTD